MKLFRLWSVWTVAIVLAVVGMTSGALYLNRGKTAPIALADDRGTKTIVPVKVILPQKGFERRSTQPGSVQAFESVRLYAKVPGFLKSQHVDIGDRVKAGQVLAILDVPELETQVKRGQAVLAQAKSRVIQMKSRVNSVTAEHDAARAAVTQAEATAKSSAAWVRFRQKQLTRMTELFALKSIDERLVDESKERYEASVETELSSKAAILTSNAHVTAFAAKVDSAKADVAFAEAEVDVAQAELAKYAVQLGFATITAPFDGVITHRTSSPGDFVRSANEGGSHEPILTIQRTDVMRVIVYVPDRDVPFADRGDTALVEIDALPGTPFHAKVSRMSKSEDANTRLMRLEIDLPNPTGKICHGMYGKVAIVLDKQDNQFSIPSGCLVGDAENGMGEIYVIRDSHAQLIKVKLGIDNGLNVAVVEGLRADDEVILNPGSELSDGVSVAATSPKTASAKSSSSAH
jgi:HlyD family secretion protein